jgi:Mg-chelatase subunit ChlD
MTQKITEANLRSQEQNILTLSLSVAELPHFHLQFENLNQLKLWQQALADLHVVDPPKVPEEERYGERFNSDTEEDDWRRSNGSSQPPRRVSSINSSSYAGGRTATTAPTEYTRHGSMRVSVPIHVPVDIVVVVPISSSMQGVKMSLVRDALNYMVHNLGDRDRMGLVTFGSSGGGVPLIGMMKKTWSGWSNILSQIRPVGQKLHRADVVEGANVAMDLLMQRKSSNPISTILLISDSSTSDPESVDFVVSRAEAAKISIHSFGLGMTHKPDTMIDLSARTKGLYTYVKDWMMLRECLAGCLGSLQSVSHQNVKLRLRLPEGSPAKFVKISGALTPVTKRATGRDAEAILGELRFGDKRDILVQLVIPPDAGASDQLVAQDPWETIMSKLEDLSGPLEEHSPRPLSIEEVPILQADLTFGDLLQEGKTCHLHRPSLLAITMLPAPSKKSGSSFPSTPAIPPHPSVVQRRMELLTSDMLSRALGLVQRGQGERAAHLLQETRTILKGLGKGGLPPVPPTPTSAARRSPPPSTLGDGYSHSNGAGSTHSGSHSGRGSPGGGAGHSPLSMSPPLPPPAGPPPQVPQSLTHSSSHQTLSASPLNVPNVDPLVVAALDAELEAALEWIHHPAVFGRDSRKAVLQAVGVISGQRAWTVRTGVERLWSEWVGGVKRSLAAEREWNGDERDGGGMGLEGVREEA